MSPRFPRTPGLRRARAASLLAALPLLLSGCIYGFTGGGLPPHIRTVYIEPFENTTAFAILSSDVQQRLQQELPRQLGVRLAAQSVADAVIRGRLTGYQELQGNFRGSGDDTSSRIDVLQSEVQITFEAEIFDVEENRSIWKAAGTNAIGTYNPQSEQVATGRTKAVTDLIAKIVQGAQSQW
jgi:hypothetical protein